MRSVCFYLFVAALVIVAFLVQTFVSGLPFAEAKINSLSPLQERQLSIFLDSYTLLTTLATAVIGAIGALVFNRYKDSAVPGPQRARAIAAAVFSCVSLYFGYFSRDQVVWMLQKNFFNLTNPRVLWMSTLQFWTFLISVLFLADMFRAALRTQRVTP